LPSATVQVALGIVALMARSISQAGPRNGAPGGKIIEPDSFPPDSGGTETVAASRPFRCGRSSREPRRGLPVFSCSLAVRLNFDRLRLRLYKPNRPCCSGCARGGAKRYL